MDKDYTLRTSIQIPTTTFERVLREIANEINTNFLFTKNAIGSLQVAAESRQTHMLQLGDILRQQRQMKTTNNRDLRVANFLNNNEGHFTP